ncbi:HNH endonuclease signature motif containing protein [Hymenobacter terrenus]|uniref:HNH endonuclease signature motif containing protein n=1 Tax=Hymenobacter terrenus TaxID=1629124 RepID=UPI0006196782|nr:HNH endonuclease signature motif containing protein [Hymenobacter terrenus]
MLQLLSCPVPLLNACHIVPWATSHDDPLPNGVALGPNLHRAFNHHLFINMQVPAGFNEPSRGGYGVRRFGGRRCGCPGSESGG